MPADAMIVIDPGPWTTVQDLGRYGYQRYGVPVSGAMDAFALRAGNLLVGNDPGAAGLEMTLAGPRLTFLLDTVVALTGADLGARLDEAYLPMWQAVPVARGMTLSFAGIRRRGARGCLAVAGGLAVPVVLSSRSTFVRARLGGFLGRPLQAGDRLPVPGDLALVDARGLWPARPPILDQTSRIRVIRGPQDGAFSTESMQTFLSTDYRVSHQSDRMGYRLEGPRLIHVGGADIISDGTPPGAVQVTGDGLPIILLADRGTAGGYTKIATVITADLPRVAQLAPGDRLRFDEVAETDAHRALRRQEVFISALARGRRRPFRRRLFSTIAGGQTVEAAGGFEAVRGTGDPDTAGDPTETRMLRANGRTWRVAERELRSAPAPPSPLTIVPTPDIIGAAAAVAAARALRATEPHADVTLSLDQPPLGPDLGTLEVDVGTPAGTVVVRVTMPTGTPVVTKVAGSTVEVWPERSSPDGP